MVCQHGFVQKSALSKLQEVTTSKPYRGYACLAKGYHQICDFRVVKNKFSNEDDNEKTSKNKGKSILVELKSEVVFLPQYFTNQFDEDDINELNSSSAENMFLYFGGQREGKR